MKYVALYERLSRDDYLNGESGSISNQKNLLEKYVKDNKLGLFRHFSDDGYSGRTFDRPAFKHMIAEVEDGNISTIVVKDMSRLGRNYLMVGYYTDIFFPNNDIRFIAINNGVDSGLNESNTDFLPFLNVMNEWYARDTSRKIQILFDSRMSQGMRCSGSTPYGYYRIAGDKNTFYIDEEAADVVRKIYDMKLKGNHPSQIAKKLTEEKILIPAAYQEKYHPENARNHSYENPFKWNDTTVKRILKRREYTGDMVLGKLSKNHSEDVRLANECGAYIFHDAHKAIISRDMWVKANEDPKQSSKVSEDKATPEYDFISPGKLICKECGRKLKYHQRGFFDCPAVTYRKNKCSSHYIRTCVLETCIINDVQIIAEEITKDKTEFIKNVKVYSENSVYGMNNELLLEIMEIDERITEISSMIKNLYRDYKDKLLSYDEFKLLLEEYKLEMENQKKLKKEKESERKLLEKDKPRPERFVSLYSEKSLLNEDISEYANDLIDHIDIHHGTGRGKDRSQQLDIYYKYIGIYRPYGSELIENEERSNI